MYGRKVKLRFFFVISILIVLILSVSLILKSLEENVVYFQSPSEIKNFAELSGYTFIEISPRVSADNDSKLVNIVLEINEGPRVYVNEINIVGNTRTVDRVIRREFSLTEGDAYNKFAINYSKKWM